MLLIPLINYVDGNVVECNTAYEGQRNTTEKHKKLMEDHKWSKYFNVDIMDSSGEDLVLDIPNGKVINKNYVGNNIKNYDSMLVISHFKGHPMEGYGGALKQLSIGIASSKGKRYIHCAGKEDAAYDDMFKTVKMFCDNGFTYFAMFLNNSFVFYIFINQIRFRQIKHTE